MFKGHGNIKHITGCKNNGILDFSASINPLDTQKMLEIISEGFDDILHYPDIDYSTLRKCIALKIDALLMNHCETVQQSYFI